ncbi:MAG: hypothetical protein IPK26_03220 [Planctomycetes bacterium]|nr:hypothetical protein [Planctomycetota bacterium]
MARSSYVFLILALLAGWVGSGALGSLAVAAWLVMAACLLAMLVGLLAARGRLSRT